MAGLVEEFFGAGGVAVDVPLVGGARGGDFIGSLVGEALSGGDVGVPGGNAFGFCQALHDQHASRRQCDCSEAGEKSTAETHEPPRLPTELMGRRKVSSSRYQTGNWRASGQTGVAVFPLR